MNVVTIIKEVVMDWLDINEFHNARIGIKSKPYADTVSCNEEFYIMAKTNADDGDEINIELNILDKNKGLLKKVDIESYVENEEVKESLKIEDLALAHSLKINDIKEINATIVYEEDKYPTNKVKVENKYKLEVSVVTRAGEIPMEGIVLYVEDQKLGITDKSGNLTIQKDLRTPSLSLKASYQNDTKALKEESCTIDIDNINTNNPSVKAENKISKIQDVLGEGTASLPGDKDFIDTYTPIKSDVTIDVKSKTIKVLIRMATISLNVDYLNQNISSEIITSSSFGNITIKGSSLCAPTSAYMLFDYWGLKPKDGSALSRKSIMQHRWDETSNPENKAPYPWQYVSSYTKTAEKMMETTTKLNYEISIPGVTTSSDPQSIPSDFANDVAISIAKGEPFITSTKATSGHIMLVRGAVVNHKGDTQWLIFNDPYGSLAGESSIYGKLTLHAPVGLRGKYKGEKINLKDDVLEIQSILKRFGKYSGEITGVCDSKNAEDPTIIAIKSYQGGKTPDGRIDPNGKTHKKISTYLKGKDRNSYSSYEKERNKKSDSTSVRGLHVYYNDKTEGAGMGTSKGYFRMQAQYRMMIITHKIALTKEEMTKKLTPCSI